MYASLSWKAEQWEKKLQWRDPDLPAGSFNWRGSKLDEYHQKYDAIEDLHVMYALVASDEGSEITVTPIERDTEPFHLKMQGGAYVYVGNGFLYWETDKQYQKLEN